MKLKKISFTLILTCSVLFSQSTNNDNLLDIEKSGKWIILPYAFSTDSTGLAGGVGAIAQGILQPQTTLVGTIFMGSEQDVINNEEADTSSLTGGFISLSNLKIPYTNRAYFSFWAMSRSIPLAKYYLDGSMNSDSENYLTSSGDERFLYANFSFVLPIGEGVDNPDGIYKLKNGFATGRENYGNRVPFETGKTTIGVKTFYHYQEFDNWSGTKLWSDLHKKPEWNTSGLRVYLSHDNTDFNLNPSRGYNFELQYSTDWGDDLQSWDFLEFKYSKYIELENLPFSQQDVLALNFWSGYSFSWDNSEELYPGLNVGRTPLDEGAKLGGMFRMRAYDSNRFTGKASLYATAEYRMTLKYNPYRDYDVEELVPLKIDWFQIVAFVEAGAVNDEYNLDLITDMKYDVGLSLRMMAADLPVRLDVATGDEGTSIWAMIQHPFDF